MGFDKLLDELQMIVDAADILGVDPVKAKITGLARIKEETGIDLTALVPTSVKIEAEPSFGGIRAAAKLSQPELKGLGVVVGEDIATQQVLKTIEEKVREADKVISEPIVDEVAAAFAPVLQEPGTIQIPIYGDVAEDPEEEEVPKPDFLDDMCDYAPTEMVAKALDMSVPAFYQALKHRGFVEYDEGTQQLRPTLRGSVFSRVDSEGMFKGKDGHQWHFENILELFKDA